MIFHIESARLTIFYIQFTNFLKYNPSTANSFTSIFLNLSPFLLGFILQVKLIAQFAPDQLDTMSLSKKNIDGGVAEPHAGLRERGRQTGESLAPPGLGRHRGQRQRQALRSAVPLPPPPPWRRTTASGSRRTAAGWLVGRQRRPCRCTRRSSAAAGAAALPLSAEAGNCRGGCSCDYGGDNRFTSSCAPSTEALALCSA